MKLVTSEQMRALEQEAVAAGTTLDALMEAAGLAVAQEVWLALGVVAGRRVLVLVGPGNNGGDGLVAARHLAEWEADVAVYQLSPRDDEKAQRVRDLGVPMFAAADDADFATLRQAIDGAEIIIDALLGIERQRPIEGALAQVAQRVNDASTRAVPPKVFAVDIPTGVDADSGRADPHAIIAETTITFGLAKVGLHTPPGSACAGKVQVIDIGLPAAATRDLPVDLLDAAWVRDRLPARPAESNKGTFGRVLAVAGSANYPGAARLSCEAAYRIGAGLVALACPDCVRAVVAPATPEVTYVPLGDLPALVPGSVPAIIDGAGAADVMLIGPGLSQADGVANAVLSILRDAPSQLRAVVADADALNAIAREPGWREQVSRPMIVTPHPGEMSRLLGRPIAEIQAERLAVAQDAAKRWNAVVVLKGAHTVVAAPDGRAAISPHANALLATAGTGDVLAGAIAGLVAQRMSPFEAAAAATYVHGVAAEEAGVDLGDRGLLAGDLLPALPRALRIVREGKAARGSSPLFPAGFQQLGGLADILSQQ